MLDPVSLKVFSESEFLLLLGAIAIGFMKVGITTAKLWKAGLRGSDV